MQPQVPAIIRRKLARLHWTLRFFVALDGIALLLYTVIALFLCDFVLDRFFEFPRGVRMVLLPVLLGTTMYVCWQRFIRRSFAAIRRDQLATLLEHYVPHLNESLITAVEWKESNDTDPELIQQTIDKAATILRRVNVLRCFRTGRVLTRLIFSFFCTALVIASCVLNFATVSLWLSRNILLSQQEYPRRSELFADGFQEGRVRIGRGDSFTFSVRANMEKPLVPETLHVRIGTSEVGYRTLLLDQFRTETRAGTRWRVFTATFPEMLGTIHLQVRGADSTLSDLCVEVVPTPTLTNIEVMQNFPEYLQRPARTLPLAGRTMIPDGTAITITATSTKPLRDAVAETADGRQLTAVDLACSPAPFDSITLTLPALREDTTIDFHLTDIDSLTNRHPIRAELGIIRDQPPVITARLEGIGPAITPEAVLPMVGEITDDNGLATAVNRYTTEPAPSEVPREPATGTVSLTGITSGQTIFPLEHAFSVSPLSVQPDDKLILHVEAKDRFDLDSTEGQTSTGQRWLLEIVTPEKLKHLLETREITLRQRFEVMIGEVTRTKDILLAYTLEPTEQQRQQAEALPWESNEERPIEERQRELETQQQRILNTITPEQSEWGKFHISRMLRDTHKEVYDLTGIIESFRTIRSELINNRIFTEDERRRIDQEIMRPMQELTHEDFPDIDALLDRLALLVSKTNEPLRPSAWEERQKILNRFDETLGKMMAIRDKMASMESFNEAVELLRSIIKQQQLLRNETQEERNRRLRDLLN